MNDALPQMPFDFDGKTYEPKHDQVRLTGQMLRVWNTILDGQWRTLQEMTGASGDSTQSISARLRDLRKVRFGSHIIERRRRGNPKDGIFEYRMKP